MRDRLIRLAFSISSYMGIILFLLINRNIDIPGIGFPEIYKFSQQTEIVIKFFLLSSLTVILARLVLWIGGKYLPNAENMEIGKIKPAEGVYLPVYVSLFVIALSFNEGFSISACFLIGFLFILWVRLERASYFNPFFLIWGYSSYEIETKNNKLVILVITKKSKIKSLEKFEHLVRINDYTYLDNNHE